MSSHVRRVQFDGHVARLELGAVEAKEAVERRLALVAPTIAFHKP